MTDCKHNQAVVCETGDCGRCGWNPEVAARRKARITGTVEVYDETRRKTVGRVKWPVLGDPLDAYF